MYKISNVDIEDLEKTNTCEEQVSVSFVLLNQLKKSFNKAFV